jgi:hypothetical protein
VETVAPRQSVLNQNRLLGSKDVRPIHKYVSLLSVIPDMRTGSLINTLICDENPEIKRRNLSICDRKIDPIEYFTAAKVVRYLV